MPDSSPTIHAQVDDLLHQAKLATNDLSNSDKARRDGIGTLATVIDQQREVIANLIAEQEDLREAHREELDALEKRLAVADSGRAEAVALAEKAVGRATAAEARMAEMTKVFDNLVASVSERNRVRIEEDRSIEEIVARSGVTIGSGGVQPKVSASTRSAPYPAPATPILPVRIPSGPVDADSAPAAALAKVTTITAPPSDRISAPATDKVSVPSTDLISGLPGAKPVADATAAGSEDVFSESAIDVLSAEERGEERRAFSGAMDAFKGLLKPRARLPLTHTQQA